MNRRHTDLVMIDRGLIASDLVPCQCEHGKCGHSQEAEPCPFSAERNVTFPGAGSFSLCVQCEATYYASGYRYGSEPMPTPHSIPSQPHDYDRKLSDELTSMNEYTRRERQGY